MIFGLRSNCPHRSAGCGGNHLSPPQPDGRPRKERCSMSENSIDRFFPTPALPDDDVFQLKVWVDNLENYLENGGNPNKYTSMIFRPHKLAWDAMQRLSCKFLYIIQQVQDFLNNVERLFTEFSDDGYDPEKGSAENFHWSMVEMAMQIRTAISVIQNEAKSSALTKKIIPPEKRTKRFKPSPCTIKNCGKKRKVQRKRNGKRYFQCEAGHISSEAIDVS
jgi:hypothetical protein